MQIIEAKNNLVKISYDTAREDLILSGFVIMKNPAQAFIAQVIHLEAESNGNFAIVKLLFNFDDNGVITTYNGSVPDVNSAMDTVQTQELLELLPVQTPILLGGLAQQSTSLTVDKKLFEDKLLICSEKDDDNKLLTKNLANQLTASGRKVLIVDLTGNTDVSANKVVMGQDFKLPLNYETINFIYEGLEDAKPETKALIQEIFLEVQEYVKTLSEKFIPFETFKDVVDDQYQETELVELVLLKNKLLKFYEDGVFAQEKEEFESLKESLLNNEATVLDLSEADESVQREAISYAYSVLSQLDEYYVFLNIDNNNSDKKLLKQIFTTKQAYTSIISPYGYKYLKELKQISKNLIFFSPIQQQSDFGSYNVFLNKLNPHEFVVCGQATQHLPLIVKLTELQAADISLIQAQAEQAVLAEKVEEDIEQAPSQSAGQSSKQDLLDAEIKKDVDEIFTAPRQPQQEKEISGTQEMVLDDELTEQDLDFIDDLNIGGEALEEENYFEQAQEDSDEAEEPQSEISFARPQPAQEIDYSQEDDVELVDENSTDSFVEQESQLASENNYSQEGSQPDFEEEIEIFSAPSEGTNSFANLLSESKQSEPTMAEAPDTILDEDILPIDASSTPIVPIYSAEVEPQAQSDEIVQGDTVMHAKYGKGTVEKMINYGAKTLCSIHFDNVGRRLLDPSLAEIKKV